MRGAAFKGALDPTPGFCASVGCRRSIARPTARASLDTLVRRLRKLARQVARDARRFKELPFPRRHRLRKRLKRLRYLAEFAAPAFHRREVDAWLKKIAPAQDGLGRYIDDVQAGARFAALPPSEPGGAFAEGWLRAQAGRSARASRKSLVRLGRTKAFWVHVRRRRVEIRASSPHEPWRARLALQPFGNSTILPSQPPRSRRRCASAIAVEADAIGHTQPDRALAGELLRVRRGRRETTSGCLRRIVVME